MASTGTQLSAQRVATYEGDQHQQQADAIKFKLAPLSQALQASQTRLALYADPNDPSKPVAGKEKEYQQTLDNMTSTIGQMRGILGDKQAGANPLEAAAGDALSKLHITNHLKNHVAQVRQQNAAKYQGENQARAGEYAQGVPPNPYQAQAAEMAGGGFSPQDIQTAQRAKAGLVPKDTTEQERFVTQYLQDHKGATQEQALRAYTDSTTNTADKPDAPLEAGGIPYGVRTGGKEYLAADLGPNGTAPDDAKKIWKTIQDAKAAKQAEDDKKEKERDDRFLQGQAAIAARMGQTEAFQEMMVGYRDAYANYKTEDAQANKTQELADTYEAQYAQPGNHSATDTALLTDYTSVLAAGGRKTQAEIALARNIGNFQLNIEQKIKKATTGELPDELRKMYLDYIKAAAKTQREDADKLKPELPQVAAPQGPTTKKNRDAQQKTKDPLGVL